MWNRPNSTFVATLLVSSCLAVPVAVAGETSVSWKAKPDADLLQSVYPPEALARSVEGTVKLDCQVTSAGETRNCSVLSETPPDNGFGAAALSLARTFEFHPATRDGAAVEAQHVRIPVTFKPPPLLTQVRWRRQPSQMDVVLAYPVKAVNGGVTGTAVINCFVTSVGTLTACKVVSETPAGMGFGDAAIDLSSSYVLAPTTDKGESVAGGVIAVPVHFNIEGAPPVGFSRSAPDSRLLKSLVWVGTPSPDALRTAYSRLGGGASDGLAIFRCHVSASGALEACRTLSSTGGRGVEGAARGLLGDFQASPSPKVDTFVDVAIHLWPCLSAAPATRPLSRVEFDVLDERFKAKTHLPRRAVEAGLRSGWATVDCMINAQGAPEACRASAEERPDLGLGVQAVAALSDMRIGTWNRQGETTVGRPFKMTVVLQGQGAD